MRPVVKAFSENVKSRYPSVNVLGDLAQRFDPLVADHVLELPRIVFDKAETCIRKIYDCAHSREFMQRALKRLNPYDSEILLKAPSAQQSVLMAYDFHWFDDKLSLIEINTNASSFLIVEAIYRSAGDNGFADAISSLKQSFVEEKRLFDGSEPSSVLIVDDQPEKQKQYAEFLMYRDLFETWGWSSTIQDVSDPIGKNFDFVYNRHTDFDLLKTPELRRLYINRDLCVSPNPREYLLLADKDRMQDFAELKVDPAILLVFPLNERNADSIWAQRKKLFFKPKRMYGSKGVYRGSSISRTVFDRLVPENSYLAQEFAPPGQFEDFKFDLRFFVYQDRIQQVCARLYKGQVTGFDTVGGGLARVHFQ